MEDQRSPGPTPLACDAVLVADLRAELLEGPVWDPATGRLVAVDILAGRVLSIDPERGDWSEALLGAPVGAVARRRAGGWVALCGSAAVALDERLAPGAVLATVDTPAGSRFNDGKPDPAGNLWVGRMIDGGAAGHARLLRIGSDGDVRVAEAGLTIPNGLGWNAAGDVMAFIDSPRQRVDLHGFDPVAGIRLEPLGTIDLTTMPGLPDGMTLDADGRVWVASWGGGEVRCYDRAGVHRATVRVPATQVTSCVFGGPDLRDLYITTARFGLGREDLEAQPLAGGLFVARPGVAGVAGQAYGG